MERAIVTKNPALFLPSCPSTDGQGVIDRRRQTESGGLEGMDKTNETNKRRKQITYKMADSGGNMLAYMVAESAFEYTASCPLCDRRVFDSTDIPGNNVHVRLKCPHCRKIVNIPFTSTM
jgi:hypothetical protein